MSVHDRCFKGSGFEPSTIVDLVRWRAGTIPRERAYAFLTDEGKKEQRVTFEELDRNARIIAARLQSIGLAGERALLIYPPGIDYVLAFFGCLYAGVVAVPAYPPDPTRLGRTLPRLQAIVEDSRPAIALSTTPILAMMKAVKAGGSLARLLGRIPVVGKFGRPLSGLLSKGALDRAKDLSSLKWISTQSMDAESADEWKPPGIMEDSIAFLQYTSGSTRNPRGVILSHKNLLHNSALIHNAFEFRPDHEVVIWLPIYHDMGLIGGVLQPLYAGVPCTLMSPIAFLQRPLTWLQAISRIRDKQVISGGPNFAYDLCVRKVTAEYRSGLDLSRWEVAFSGAEPVRPQTVDRFSEAFRECGFRKKAFLPCYGLAEATLIVSGGRTADGPVLCTLQKSGVQENQVRDAAPEETSVLSIVGCGPTLMDQEIAIVDPESLTRCLPDRIGEIWVSGPSAARGFWGRAEETEETFHARLADTGEGPYLRTGDLGFLRKGELFITGRIKDLMIIRGRNHYPQDIELTVEQSHPSLRQGCCAAFSVEMNGEERLVVAQEVSTVRVLDKDEIVGAIRKAVAEEHGLQIHAVALLKPRSIPKTSSGKIRRHACRSMFLEGKLDILESSILEESPPVETETRLSESLLAQALLAMEPQKRQSLLESYLQDHLARVLKALPSDLSPDQPISFLGVDSIMAVDLVKEMESSMGVTLEIRQLFQDMTISRLASLLLEQLTRTRRGHEETRVPSEEREAPSEFPLSYGQRALWFLQQLNPSSVAYNVVHAAQIPPDTDLSALRMAIRKLTDRHPALRTAFSSHEGEPVQRVFDQVDPHFEVEDAAAWERRRLDERIAEEIFRPFDLHKPPLLRTTVFLRAPRNHILLFSMHHIITDLWSYAILFLSELPRLYKESLPGSSIPPLKPVKGLYSDHVLREAEMLQGPEGERLWKFWQQQLSGVLPVLNLPTDRPRPHIQSDRGAARYFSFDTEITEALKFLAEDCGTSLSTLVLAAFQTLLHRYTGQDDILVGTPKFGRNHSMARVVGYFINPVVIRSRFTEDMTFSRFLSQVHETVETAYRHDVFPFSLLVERLAPDRDLSHSPIFQAMFAWQKTTSLVNGNAMNSFVLGEEGFQAEAGDLIQKPVFLKDRVTPLDLALWVVEGANEGRDRLRCTMEYKTDLFDEATIDRMMVHLHVLLRGIVTRPHARIGDLPLLTEEERRPLHTKEPRSVQREQSAQTVHRLFEAQVERTPDSIALTDGNRCLSYRELNHWANQLGSYLRKAGVTPESRVGVLLDRSLESVISLFGILKAGGAYLPLDPDSPPERLRYMIEDSGAGVILTLEEARGQRSEVGDQHSDLRPPAASLQPRTLDRDRNVEGADRSSMFTSSPISELRPLTSVFLDADWSIISRESDENPEIEPSPDNLAYVIYTSGSTGLPKGVLVSHGAFAEHCLEIRRHYQLTPGDRVLQFASLVFDASLEQIVPPLITGSRVVLMHGDLWAPKDFRRKVSELGLTIINLPPAYWSQVVLQWDQQKDPVQGLRLVIIGGDVVRPKSIEALAGTSMNAARILNAYGPTETTITATTFEIPSDPAGVLSMSRVPIGEPLSGRKACILDKYGNPVPAGLNGELCLGGVGVARGYLNRPELTAEKFVPDPFATPQPRNRSSSDSAMGGERLYRTGDLARSLLGGGIDFLGRIDHQVKVRGFRVELGEIETMLRKNPGVTDALVLSEEHEEAGDPRLVAYVVFKPDRAPSAEDLRRHLQEKVPSYMVPASFVSLERFPMTPGGKIDRIALLKTQGAVLKPQTERIFPRSPVERRLAEIWSELLGVREIAVNDNFFALGGHSLIATHIVARVRDIYRVDIPLRRLFESPTIADLAVAIAQTMAEQEEEADLENLLSEVEALSREKAVAVLDEVQALPEALPASAPLNQNLRIPASPANPDPSRIMAEGTGTGRASTSK